MFVETNLAVEFPSMFTAANEEWQQRREAIWTSAVGPEAVELIKPMMRRRVLDAQAKRGFGHYAG